MCVLPPPSLIHSTNTHTDDKSFIGLYWKPDEEHVDYTVLCAVMYMNPICASAFLHDTLASMVSFESQKQAAVHLLKPNGVGLTSINSEQMYFLCLHSLESPNDAYFFIRPMPQGSVQTV